MNVTAICERSGGWWAVTVPEIDGGFTQAHRLDQVPAMVADLVNLATDTPAEDVHVTIDAHVSGTAAPDELRVAAALEAEAKAMQEQANACRRAAFRAYKGAGLPVRDIAHLTGVSFQRVSQIIAEADDTRPVTEILQEAATGAGKIYDVVAEAARWMKETDDVSTRREAGAVEVVTYP